MPQQLKKNIGLWSAVSLVIGGIIGAGIFMRPASMAERLGSPVLLLVVWLVGGAVSLLGGMIYAELGTLFPETGGPYVYLQKAYGDFTAFLYGWSTMAVINTAAIASIAFVCAQYTGYFIHLPRWPPEMEHSIRLHIPFLADIYPLENFGVKMLASAIILLLIGINYLSTRYGNVIQVVSTLMKTLALALLVGGILLSGKGHAANFVTGSPGFHPGTLLLLVGFMGAISGAFSSYDGWNNLNMVAGEIENPQRNISRSLFIGIGICIAVYILTTLAYNFVLPVGEMARSPLVAADAMEKVVGVAAAGLVSGLIALTAFGATHINLLTNARITFAMGEEGSFFPWTGKIHPRFGTPGNAVIVIGVWSILFVLSGSFDILADMFVFMSWVFYGLTGLGLFVLRLRMPEAPRPYRVRGYPWLPLLFVVFTLFYLVTTIYGDIAAYRSGKSPIVNSVFGVVLTATGIPFYLYFQRKRSKHEK